MEYQEKLAIAQAGGNTLVQTINESQVTAIRLADGWHDDVVDFAFYGDGHSNLITLAGASWSEPNSGEFDCNFSCPLSAILALCEGAPRPVPGSRIERPAAQLHRAVKWLEEALQDGMRHAAKQLRKDAKESANISSETLERAYAALHGKKPVKANCYNDGTGGQWYWAR